MLITLLLSPTHFQITAQFLKSPKYKVFNKLQNLRLASLKNICYRKIQCNSYDDFFLFEEDEKKKKNLKCGKRRKCWLPAFSPCFKNVYLTLSQTANLDWFKLKEIADDNLKFDGNGRMFIKWVENTV